MKFPSVTVAFLSWNRLHYLRSTLESARRCMRGTEIEWIISDNASEEPGLEDYLSSCDWATHLWSKKQTHADAMNEIVSRASGRYLLIWPDDMQFVVEGDWLPRLVETLDQNSEIGSVGLNFLRRKTIRRLFGPFGAGDVVPLLADLRRWRWRRPRRIAGPEPLHTAGWRRPGVVASGIPSLTRTDYWRSLGPWSMRPAGTTKLLDSSLGAEDLMIETFQQSGHSWQQAAMLRPVAADIINDDLGCKAKVRGGSRYGVYTPPAKGEFYYEIMAESALAADDAGFPLCFEDHVKPIGFQLPLDEFGDLRKASLNESVVATISV